MTIPEKHREFLSRLTNLLDEYGMTMHSTYDGSIFRSQKDTDDFSYYYSEYDDADNGWYVTYIAELNPKYGAIFAAKRVEL